MENGPYGIDGTNAVISGGTDSRVKKYTTQANNV